MQAFGQATVYGLLQGGLLAMIAVGFSLVWGLMNVINLAHGAYVILGAYTAWSLNDTFGLDPMLGALVAAATLFVAGYLVQRVLVNQIVNAPILLTLLLTFGLQLVLVQIMIVAFTADYRAIATSYADRSLTLVADIHVPYGRLIAFAVAVAATAALVVFTRRSRTGIAILATGMDRLAARLMGINARHTYALAHGIAAGLAGAAGALIGMVGTFSPPDAGTYTLLSFVVAVMGGLGNMSGALIGGLVLGVVQAWAGQLVSGTWVNAFAFAALVLVLIVRPAGLAGRAFYEARVEP